MLGFTFPVVLAAVPVLFGTIMFLAGLCSLFARVLGLGQPAIQLRQMPRIPQLPEQPQPKHGPKTAFELDGLIAQLPQTQHQRQPNRSSRTAFELDCLIAQLPSRNFDDEDTQIFVRAHPLQA